MRNDIPKTHKLIGLMSDIDIEYPILYVLEQTGISNINSLRVICSKLKDKGIICLKIKFGKIKRIA